MIDCFGRIVKIKRRSGPAEPEAKKAGFTWALPKTAEDQKEEPKSLFGNGAAKTESKGLFGTTEPSKPLFGGDSNGKSLFGETKPTGSLFGNAAPGSLFGNAAPTGSLFGGDKPADGSLFGSKPTGSLFDAKNSLFGNTTSIFSKPAEDKDGDDSDGTGKGGSSPPTFQQADEPPSVDLKDQKAVASPFNKLFEKEVMKYKQITPEKKNCGAGKLSI